MFVYFIQAGDGDGPVKIGIARDPELRRDELQVGNAEELHLLAIQPGGPGIEVAIHRCFAEGRIRGEWFRADTPGLRDHIRRALHAEPRLDEARRICSICGVWPVLPPRTRVCSAGCERTARCEAKNRWKLNQIA